MFVVAVFVTGGGVVGVLCTSGGSIAASSVVSLSFALNCGLNVVAPPCIVQEVLNPED